MILKNIPFINNETFVVIVAYKNQELYATKIKLGDKTELHTSLKERNISEFK